MEKSINKILVFLLPLLIIWAGFYYYFNYNIKYTAYPVYQLDKNFKDAPKHFDYLIGGHSRLNRAIDEQQLQGAQKATTYGESFIETYYKLKFIVNKTDKNFHTVLLPFEPGTFKPNDFRRSIYWVDYVNFFEVGLQKREMGRYITEWLKAKFLPFLPYYKKKFKAAISNENDHLNIDKKQGRFDLLEKSQQQKMIQEDIFYLNKIGIVDKTAKYYVRKTVELLQQNNIKLIYIKAPLTEAYSKAMRGMDKSAAVTHAELEDFLKGFDNVGIVDFEKLFWDEEHLFSDHHHLNLEGQKVFTKELLKTIKKEKF